MNGSLWITLRNVGCYLREKIINILFGNIRVNNERFAYQWCSLNNLCILISTWSRWGWGRNNLIAHTQNVSESLIPAFFSNDPSRFLIVNYVDGGNDYQCDYAINMMKNTYFDVFQLKTIEAGNSHEHQGAKDFNCPSNHTNFQWNQTPLLPSFVNVIR